MMRASSFFLQLIFTFAQKSQGGAKGLLPPSPVYATDPDLGPEPNPKYDPDLEPEPNLK